MKNPQNIQKKLKSEQKKLTWIIKKNKKIHVNKASQLDIISMVTQWVSQDMNFSNFLLATDFSFQISIYDLFKMSET